MTGDLVFITGATGHVGFAIVLSALAAGYRVRASVRQESQAEALKSNMLLAPSLDRIEFVIVPDITVPGAFDNVLDGVKYIQHIASPLPKPTPTPEQDIVQPAVRGTTSILLSALKAPSIHRVVITSSIVALIPDRALTYGDPTTVYTVDSRVSPIPTSPWDSFADAYRGAKVQALDAVDQLQREKRPHFTIVTLMPGYVFGANVLISTAEKAVSGSNALVLGIALGMKPPGTRPFFVTHLDDLARSQILALDEDKIVGTKSFILGSSIGAYDDVNEILKRRFPGAVEKGILPLGGSVAGTYQQIDEGESLSVFGPLKSFEEQVVSVVRYYLELKVKA